MTGRSPERFSGAWVRRGFVVGTTPVDDAEVLWLQAGSWYADLRIPHEDHGGPVEAFAGRSSWAEPAFTWHHDLDWLGTFTDDVGCLALEGDDLIETGTFTREGTAVPYRERWVRSGPAWPRLVAVGEEPGGLAMLVRAGRHALALTGRPGGFTAQRWDETQAGGWETVFARGVGDEPAPRPRLDGLSTGDAIALGRWRLRVIDS